MKFLIFILYKTVSQPVAEINKKPCVKGRDVRCRRKTGQKKSTRLRGLSVRVFYLPLGSQVQSLKIRSSRSRPVFLYVIRISRSFLFKFNCILTRPSKFCKLCFPHFQHIYSQQFSGFRQKSREFFRIRPESLRCVSSAMRGALHPPRPPSAGLTCGRVRKNEEADKVNCRAAAREGGLDHMEFSASAGNGMQRVHSDAASYSARNSSRHRPFSMMYVAASTPT